MKVYNKTRQIHMLRFKDMSVYRYGGVLSVW